MIQQQACTITVSLYLSSQRLLELYEGYPISKLLFCFSKMLVSYYNQHWLNCNFTYRPSCGFLCGGASKEHFYLPESHEASPTPVFKYACIVLLIGMQRCCSRNMTRYTYLSLKHFPLLLVSGISHMVSFHTEVYQVWKWSKSETYCWRSRLI